MLKLATRGSDLALAQAHRVRDLLHGQGQQAELLVVHTRGDRVLDLKLSENLDKGLFTTEVELAVVEGRADLAVHSLKDMPTAHHPDCAAPVVVDREAAEDLLIVNPSFQRDDSLLPLVPGARVGTSAARREALIKHFRPDLFVEPIRGNVPTRLEKLRRGEVDAVILARAGIHRLGLDLSDLSVFRLSPEHWLPAPGQGAVAVQFRVDDSAVLSTVAGLRTTERETAVRLERKILELADAGCHVAIGASARYLGGDQWSLRAGLGDSDRGWRDVDVTGVAEGLPERAWADLAEMGSTSPQAPCWQPLELAP